VRQNPQHKSIFTVVSSTSAPPFNLFFSNETFATKAEPLYATKTSHRKEEIFLYEYPLH
jgi:hypothetical protein